jgi:phage-related protein
LTQNDEHAFSLVFLYKNMYIRIMNEAKIIKELEWIGSALKDLQALPLPVRRVFGYALYAVQLGEKPPEAKPLKGFGTDRGF